MLNTQRGTTLDPNLVLRASLTDGSLECHFRLAPVCAARVLQSGIDRDCLGRLLSSCVMGFRGVGLRAGMLEALGDLHVPSECFHADDLAISYYLALVQRFTVRRLRLRTKYKFDNEFAWSNSSINTFHRQRKFGVNRACAASLRSLMRASKPDQP